MQSYFELYKANMLELLEKIVNVDSGSYLKEGTDKVGHILIDEYRKLGFVEEIDKQTTRGNNILLKHKDAVNPRILLIGHIDTVFQKGTVAERPFTIEGDIARGPGVFDMKASHVQILYVLKYLIEKGNESYKNVVIILNTDEEIGSVHSRPLIETTAKQVDHVLIMEPTDESGRIITGRKGGGKFFLKVHGIASHAGAAPEKGVSAIEELASKILQLHALTKEEGIHVNVGLINGGTSVNTIAPYAEAGIDLRFETREQGEFAKSRIIEICNTVEAEGIQLELTGDITRPAWQQNNEGTLQLSALVQEEGTKLGLTIEVGYSGGGSDGNFTGDLNIPTIDGLGPRGSFAHQKEEYVIISSFAERGELLINILNRLTKEQRKEAFA